VSSLNPVARDPQALPTPCCLLFLVLSVPCPFTHGSSQVLSHLTHCPLSYPSVDLVLACVLPAWALRHVSVSVRSCLASLWCIHLVSFL
jgi:hypothetical protein